MACIQRLRRGGLSFAGGIYHFDLPESPAKPLLNISFLRSTLPEKELTVCELMNLKLIRHPPRTDCNRQLPFLHNRFFVDWPRGGSLRLGVTEGGGFPQRKGA
jgi:hypothetical protein